jgi:peptidoglycan/LPS O-acetylase OafA/YrhL
MLRLLVLTLAGGLVLAAVSWYAIERPAQRLAERIPRLPTSAMTLPAAVGGTPRESTPTAHSGLRQ